MVLQFQKELVVYQSNPFFVQILAIEGDYRCGNCLFYIKPNRCLIVEGYIEESGWCILWVGLPKLTLTKLLKR